MISIGSDGRIDDWNTALPEVLCRCHARGIIVNAANRYITGQINILVNRCFQ